MTTGTVSPGSGTTAIQNVLNANQQVMMPAGSYSVSQITVLNGCTVIGEGAQATGITGGGVQFNANCEYSQIRDLSIAGAAPYNALQVPGGSVGCTVRDVYAVGGVAPLYTDGVDCMFEDCVFSDPSSGYGAVTSQGANWYMRCRLDSTSLSGTTYGFWQSHAAPSNEIRENHLTLCSIQGGYTWGVIIADDYYQAVTVFENCVIGTPCAIGNSKATIFNGGENLGYVANFGGFPVIVNGSFGGAGNTLYGYGYGAITQAGNYNLG